MLTASRRIRDTPLGNLPAPVRRLRSRRDCWADSAGCADNEQPDARPLKIVVPFAPGGGSDTYARIIKKGIDDNKLSKQPIVIINRDGAGATLGSRYVKEAEPDGNTVLFLHEAIVTARYSGNVLYGPEAFEPIAATGSVAMVIAVMDDSPYTSLSELMDEASTHPNTVPYAGNFGAPVHFLAKQLERAVPGAAFKFTQSGGGTTRFHHLSGGHVDVSAFSLAEYMSFRSVRVAGLGRVSCRPSSGTSRTADRPRARHRRRRRESVLLVGAQEDASGAD